MSRRGIDGEVIVAWVTIVAIALAVVGSAAWGLVWTYGPTTVRADCTITNLDTVTKKSGEGNRGDLKMVFTENCGELAVDDNLLRGYIDSGSVYGQLQEGKTYDLTTIGWRWHLPTAYPNVVEATESR